MTLSKERLEEIESVLSAGALGYSIEREEMLAMARELLALRERAEPVLWEIDNPGEGSYYTEHEPQPGDYRRDLIIAKFYAEPPAPVVPEEATPDNIDILASIYAPRGVTYQWDIDERNAAADSWNACRAAILQGKADVTLTNEGTIAVEPVSQPYKLPDGWVAVPVEPTKEMCDIGHIGVDVLTGVTEDNEYYSINGPDAAKVYRAMLAAAPAPGKER